MKSPFLFTLLLSTVFAFTLAPPKNGKTSFHDLHPKANPNGIPVYLLNGVPFTGTTYDEYASQKIFREYTFSNGLIQLHTGWYSDGTKEREISYHNGLLNGRSAVYHRSGHVFSEEFYCNGQKEGKHFYYNCDGSLRSEKDHVGGFPLMSLEYEHKKCQKDCKVDEGC